MAPNAPSAHPVVSARAGSSGPTGIKAMAKGIASPAPLRHPKAGPRSLPGVCQKLCVCFIGY